MTRTRGGLLRDETRVENTRARWGGLNGDKARVENTRASLGIKALGLFVPFLKEMYEMRYQYEHDYYFDSAKFNRHFNYTPVTNAQAVKETVAELKKNAASV